MPNYRRHYIAGGSYFFTVNLLDRKESLLVDQIERLRESVRHVQQKMPFQIDGWVVLPDHMHCLWTLPVNDDEYSKRWQMLKKHFSKSLPNTEYRSANRIKRGERGIWQRRFWEHTIRDQQDFNQHMDYIHFNPVKHGLVDAVIDWPYSTFHRYVEKGIYSADWGTSTSESQYSCRVDKR